MYTILFSLDIKNCLRLLAFGDLYKVEDLKKTALEMIAQNMGKIVDTDAWEKFTKEYSKLTVEVTKRLVSSKAEMIEGQMPAAPQQDPAAANAGLQQRYSYLPFEFE